MSHSNKNFLREPSRNRKGGIRDQIVPYALVAFGLIFFALILLFLMLWKIEQLARLGLIVCFFFIVLVPFGLSVAVICFGCLKSFAYYRGKQLGGALELGGPIVGFVLTIFLGYLFLWKIVNFPLTVFVHGEAGRNDIVPKNAGRVFLDFGGDRRHAEIVDRGQAFFSEIPANKRGQPVTVILESYTFELVNPNQQYCLDSPSIYLPVRKKAGRIAGSVQDPNGKPIAGADITVAGISAKTDIAGHFEVSIPGNKMQPELSLQVVANGFATSQWSVVPNSNEAEIILYPEE